MVSIICPTIRKNGLELVLKALKEQTYRDFEVIICSPFNPNCGIWVKDDFKGGFWSISRSYNAMIKKAKGDLIVSWQDYTFSNPRTLEILVNNYKENPRRMCSVIGDKYLDDDWKIKGWNDPRRYMDCTWREIEWNLCSCPKELLYEVGGFDEQMDFKFFGLDGYNVNERIKDLNNVDFKLIKEVETYSIFHERNKDWDKFNGINGLYTEHRKQRIQNKEWPKLDYLSN